jgi:hypothetical protein
LRKAASAETGLRKTGLRGVTAFDSSGAVVTCAQRSSVGTWSGWTSLGIPGR